MSGGAPVGILSDGTTALVLVEEDELWAARMVMGEEGAGASAEQASAVLSCLLRRWSMLASSRVRRGLPPQFGGFSAMLRAFSQPLQPRRAIEHARAAAIQSIPWDDIPSTIRETVQDILRGRRPLSQQGTGAVNFAAPDFVASRLPANPDWETVPSPARNTLVSTAQGRAAREPRVSPGPAEPSIDRRWFLVALAIGAGWLLS